MSKFDYTLCEILLYFCAQASVFLNRNTFLQLLYSLYGRIVLNLLCNSQNLSPQEYDLWTFPHNTEKTSRPTEIMSP